MEEVTLEVALYGLEEWGIVIYMNKNILAFILISGKVFKTLVIS